MIPLAFAFLKWTTATGFWNGGDRLAIRFDSTCFRMISKWKFALWEQAAMAGRARHPDAELNIGACHLVPDAVSRNRFTSSSSVELGAIIFFLNIKVPAPLEPLPTTTICSCILWNGRGSVAPLTSECNIVPSTFFFPLSWLVFLSWTSWSYVFNVSHPIKEKRSVHNIFWHVKCRRWMHFLCLTCTFVKLKCKTFVLMGAIMWPCFTTLV